MMLLLKLHAQGRHGRSVGKGKKGALDEERWGPDLPRGCSGWSQAKGTASKGRCAHTGASLPIKQVAASQIRLIFLITEALASSQDQGGQF